MKIKIIFATGLIPLLSVPILNAQSLSEKKYDLTGTNEQIFSSIEYINFGDNGSLLVSSTKSTASSDPKTIIERVDEEGEQVWSTEYDPPGNSPFDKRSLIRSHRAGYNPEYDANYPDEFKFMVTGEITSSGYLKPGYIQLDPYNGDVLNEVFYDNNWGKAGHLSAIHTVADGPQVGAYMVGSIMTEGWPDNYSPLLIKVGGTSNFANYYEVGKDGAETYYHDVDVEEDAEGVVIAVGHMNDLNYGAAIIDTYNASSGDEIDHYKYTFEYGARLSCVKSIGGGRVICGGTMLGLIGFVMEVDLSDGKITWARYVAPGSVKYEGGIEVDYIADVIEIELDKEAMPIIMGVSGAHLLGESDPQGPGIFARLENNGREDWAISEEMEGGFSDLEPQDANQRFISSLTGISEAGYTSKLTFADGNSHGFSGCQSEINLSMDPFEADESEYDPERSKVALSAYSDSPTFVDVNIEPDPGCCWLPYFNPLPWNHPWESTYWPHTQADLDAGSGYPNYDWILYYTKDVATGDIVASNVTGSSQTFTVPFQGTYGTLYFGGKSAEISRVEITVTDDEGCFGWDATVVHVADDGYHNVPDYSESDNIFELPDYYYCQTSSLSPSRHIYGHHGTYLTSNGFTPTPPASPHNILNTSGFNWLQTVGIKLFEESVEDSYNDGGTPRNNTIETDVEVENCGCNPTITGGIEKITDDGRVHYAFSQRDLKIVKYSYGLHMEDPLATLPDNLKLVKRITMRPEAASTAIDDGDFLIPDIDDRYLSYYSAYADPNQDLYLDMWFTASTTYPYVICGHRSVQFSNAVVTRKANPHIGGSESNPAKENVNGDIIIYPNPTNGFFELDNLPEYTELGIYDLQGRKIYSINASNINQSRLKIDLNRAERGMYLIKINTREGQVLVEKLIKE